MHPPKWNKTLISPIFRVASRDEAGVGCVTIELISQPRLVNGQVEFTVPDAVVREVERQTGMTIEEVHWNGTIRTRGLVIHLGD